MKKGCFLYLVRTSIEDLNGLNKSLELLKTNVFPFCKEVYDILIFHESSFNQEYKKAVIKLENNILFQEIQFQVPKYSQDILERIPEYYPHPTHGPGGPYAHTLPEPHKGFTMGYRHMFNFFSGLIYESNILKEYKYYLRLDTDSFCLSQIKYDLFDWMETTNTSFAFIEQAVQKDNPKVILGLWNSVKTWIKQNHVSILKTIEEIPEGTMYYTNFELAETSFFLPGSSYYEFYKFINQSGGIFTNRWGDAPIKYIGVNLFLEKEKIKPVRGFVYQHGAVYHL